VNTKGDFQETEFRFKTFRPMAWCKQERSAKHIYLCKNWSRFSSFSKNCYALLHTLVYLVKKWCQQLMQGTPAERIQYDLGSPKPTEGGNTRMPGSFVDRYVIRFSALHQCKRKIHAGTAGCALFVGK